ncbi:unnamed protein product [Larinioides sclopetarius]|uniref:Uncharacterized protein n=1 Tax=Larinioides sclopetarius TaxID=280406 RepID=A0AAV1Z559_9ARAC
MRSVLSLISLRNKNFKKLSSLCALYTRTTWCTEYTKKFDPGEHYRIKKVPEDIWADNKDPKFTGVEVVENRWHFVERLFPKLRVPEPPKVFSTAGWKAPSGI